jgi:2-keto-3-deoxy-L-rhamnonate aldolase RhmA
MDAVKHVCKVARNADKALAAYAGIDELDMLRELGVTMFALGSEHSLVQAGIKNTLERFKA